jgi:hypothetical protein
MKTVMFPNYGYVVDRVPDTLFNKIKKECLSIKTKTHKRMISGVTGKDTANHFLTLASEYTKNFSEYAISREMLTKPLYLKPGKPWVNIQQKGEYVPNHDHKGLYSYVAFIQIPYDIKKEFIGNPNQSKYASCFEIIYNSVVGSMKNYRIRISKEEEGVILMFPSNLYHCVYPFTTSNKPRISIAGNLFYDSEVCK